jgi:hypothetical protein
MLQKKLHHHDKYGEGKHERLSNKDTDQKSPLLSVSLFNLRRAG